MRTHFQSAQLDVRSALHSLFHEPHLVASVEVDVRRVVSRVRLLGPLRDQATSFDQPQEVEYYLPSFLLQKSIDSVDAISMESTLAGDVDIPSLIQLSFFYLVHAKPGLSWDVNSPDDTMR